MIGLRISPERFIHTGLTRIILLTLLALSLDQTIFAESNSAAHNNSQEEIKPSTVAAPRSPLKEISCKKTQERCRSLCEEALSTEARASKLEKSTKEADAKAAAATQKAVSIEEITNRTLQSMSMAQDASNFGSVDPKSKGFWKLVSIIPRLFLSREGKARYKEIEKEFEKQGVPAASIYPGKRLADMMMYSQMASKSAKELLRAAAEAKLDSDGARADADSMRQSYESCLSRMESQ